MTRLATFVMAMLAAAQVAGGCVPVTVNINFPQEKIDSAAASVEDLVRNPAPPAEAPKGRPSSAASAVDVAVIAGSVVGPARAEAQAVPELKTRTPAIMAVIESRRGRFPQLSAATKQGCVGETRDGLLEARPGAGCPATIGALVAAENADRMVLYRTLVEQNNMPPSDLARVQAAFAKTHRDRLPPGSWVQNADGSWVRK